MNKLVDFNVIYTRVVLFHTKMLGNRIHIYIFGEVVS